MFLLIASFLLLLAVAVVWIYQFVQVMILAEEDFVWRYDKVLWVVAFVFAFPVAPFAFIAFKSARLEMIARGID